MSRLQILISCMHQKDDSIIARSKVMTGAVVVNQCDEDSKNKIASADGFSQVMINTTERGLSRSRNMAIANATGEFCLVADDDERFVSDIEEKVSSAFDSHPTADVLIFAIGNLSFKPNDKPYTVNYFNALHHISSVQISFRRESVVNKGIKFDTEMGSGTGHGAGEEVKFIFDCLHAGLKIEYVPIEIGTLQRDSASQWFNAYDAKFYFWNGWSARRIMGLPLSMLWAIFVTIRKYPNYKKNCNPLTVFTSLVKGAFHKI